MVCEDVLKVKNLPKELTDAEKVNFLKHFDATKVKIITSKSQQKSTVYARFETKEKAREVLFRLHQTYILQNRLCVEYSDQDLGLPKIKKPEIPTNSKDHFKTFINRINAFNSAVGFNQPPPSHLKYQYPVANRPTINNIGHALATIPKFYTQVLHLMNKMNLPPPFAVPDPKRAPAPPKTPPKPQKNSSEESELESDEDAKQNKDVIPQKRSLPQKKVIKRPKFIKPNVLLPSNTLKERPEDVFDINTLNPARKIDVKAPGAILETGEPEKEEEMGVIPSKLRLDDEIRPNEVISEEELTSNQIPRKDLDVLPVFKDYHPGVPTARLYIKNIAKNVELKDFEYIYNRYKAADDDKNFEIRLMQEGRMKGQAFVSFRSVEIAQKALNETNAFILKDKPLVVVFAKTAPAKK